MEGSSKKKTGTGYVFDFSTGKKNIRIPSSLSQFITIFHHFSTTIHQFSIISPYEKPRHVDVGVLSLGWFTAGILWPKCRLIAGKIIHTWGDVPWFSLKKKTVKWPKDKTVNVKPLFILVILRDDRPRTATVGHVEPFECRGALLLGNIPR